MILAQLASLALAQAVNAPGGPDLEYRKGDVPGDQRLRVGGLLEVQWHEFDNLDFRPLDETSDQSILDSDDRGRLAFTGAALDLQYDVDDHTEVAVSASLRGLWGSDQTGDVNTFGGWLYFNNLYAKAFTKKEGPSLLFGRTYFEIGGLGGAPDYVLADVLDLVEAQLPIPGFGTITAIPVNAVAMSGDDSGPDFLDYVGQSSEPIYNLRGDRATIRSGLVIAADDLPIPLDARAYAFYTDIGGAGTGSDISYAGELGNFTDNDWLLNAGVRAQATLGPVKPYASFDLSDGIDRKELVAQDVDALGFAWGAGATLNLEKTDDATGDKNGVNAQLTYFDCLGSAWSENGLQYSHGYVSMKGRQVGGLIMNRYLGWHPTAYLGTAGVDDTPNEPDRKSGTRVLNAGVEVALPGPVALGLGWWYAQDTGITYLDLSSVDTITPPYGYSRGEFSAEARAGKALGNEIDATATAALTPSFDLLATGGILLPGAYYAIEIDRVAGDALGAADPANAWGVTGGTRVRF